MSCWRQDASKLRGLRGIRLALVGGAIAAAQLIGFAAQAQEPTAPPAYSYSGSKLLLLVKSPVEEPTVVRWRAVNSAGSAVGALRRKRVELRPGENRIELMVGDAGGHRVSWRLAGKAVQLWANRGIWYLNSAEVRVDKTVHTRSHSNQAAVWSDRFLAGGVRAYVRSEDGKTPLELGRTLGYDSDRGVELGRFDALVLVAGGTVGPVRLTLAQVVDKESTQYWDYSLILSKELRRYEIPLTLFRQRVKSKRRLRTLFSVSLQTTTPARRTTFLEIDSLALNHSCRQIKAIARQRGRVKVKLRPGRRQGEAELWLASLQGAPEQRPFKGLVSSLPTKAARLWVCYLADDGGRGCDPPDAPLTAYAAPPAPGRALILDRFEYLAPLNFARQPTMVFASSVKLQQEMVVKRSPGSLLLRYHPQKSSDYAGYLSPLPEKLPDGLRAVQLTVRGQVAASAVTIGLKDANGYEPRVVLQDYLTQLSDGWQTVRIPFAAFDAALAGIKGGPRQLKEPVSLAVTMGVSRTPAVHELELQQIQLIPERCPVVVASFDGAERYRTAQGAAILFENRRGVKLAADLQSSGKKGRALTVNVAAPEPKGYGLVGLGLGRLDVRGYSRLSFWIRSAGPRPTRALLHLSDGKKVAKLALADWVRPAADWQHVSLPLDRVAGDLDRRALQQLTLVWEDQEVFQETLSIDEIVFE